MIQLKRKVKKEWKKVTEEDYIVIFRFHLIIIGGLLKKSLVSLADELFSQLIEYHIISGGLLSSVS